MRPGLALWWCVLMVVVAAGSVHATLEGGKYDPGLTMVPYRPILAADLEDPPADGWLRDGHCGGPHRIHSAAGLVPNCPTSSLTEL